MRCAQCGTEFQKDQSHTRGRRAKYCGSKCKDAAAASFMSAKACKVCGSLLTTTQARYANGVCSRDCYLSLRRMNRTRACAICGTQFRAKTSTQQCCGAACASVYRGQMKTKAAPIACLVSTCKHCGKQYKPKAVNRLDYCSRECAYAAKRVIAKKCPACGLTASQHKSNKFCTLPKEAACANCGKTFLSHNRRNCCSKACYMARASRKSCEYDHAKRLARAPVTKQCANCGKEFSRVMHPEMNYCSARCANRAAKNNRKHFERQADIHPRSSPVYRARIFKRDNYVCQLCGQPIDFGLPAGDPMSGTIDHVIPLSKGGWHAPDNVQSAHLRCNSKKGAH
jgi:5-methylcytosine-specific restriction endonuclease McrA